MDPVAASIHQPHHPSLQLSQDPGRYIFEHARFALQSPADDWTNAAHPSASYLSDHSHLPSSPKSVSKHYPAPSHPARLTRNRAAALAKEADQQHLNQQPQHLHQPFSAAALHPQNYNTSGFLNDEPTIPLNVDTAPSFTSPPQGFPYHPSFPHNAASPSPPASSSASGPTHPPPDQTINGNMPLGNIYQHANTYATHILASGRVEGYALEDIPSATLYGGASNMSIGTEIMRVPSASPSVASGELGSPGPDEFAHVVDRGLPSSRSSSRPHSLETFDYPGSGPISPLSSTYATQSLPPSFASVTSGYLHGPSVSQTPLPSAHSFPPLEHDASLHPVAETMTPTGARNRSGQKTKTKLTDMDRKFICVFAANHPKARQEDIATKFAVERSTVSKILKCKDKWMKVDFFSSEARVVKHRPSKFPELESTLIHHIRMRIAAREPVNDAFIKKMALELAQQRGIGKDKFKASSGWVENFKHRHDLRKGASWDKTTSISWAASSAKSNEPNGHGLGSIGSGPNDDNAGHRDAVYPSNSQGSEEFHADASGAEE